jgi:hypothetical protein
LQVIVSPSADTGPLQQTFIFANRPILRATNDTQGAWFYCAITYKDIFGFERHTVYYVGLYGTGAEFPNNQKYNHWD